MANKMGRPRTPEEFKRGRVSIAVSEEDREVLQRAADEMGQTVSGYVRWVALRAAKEARG